LGAENEKRLTDVLSAQEGALDPLTRLEIYASLLEIPAGSRTRMDPTTIENSMLEAFDHVPYSERVHAPHLMRRVGILIGAREPEVLGKIIEAIGVGPATAERVRPLLEVIPVHELARMAAGVELGKLPEPTDQARFNEAWKDSGAATTQESALLAKLLVERLLNSPSPLLIDATIALLKDWPESERSVLLA